MHTITSKLALVTLLAVFAAALVAGGGTQADHARAAFPGTNGKIVFDSNRDGNWEVYVMDPNGDNQVNRTNNSAWDSKPAWSPDGTKIAFHSTRDGNYEIYVMDADGTNRQRLTNNSAGDWEPAWSPDGTKMAFESERDGNYEIYMMDSVDADQDGNGDNLVRLTNNSADETRCAWSPDGTKIAFASFRDDMYGDIYVMDAVDANQDGNGDNLSNLTNEPGVDGDPAWSPDGQKIAFVSDRDGYFDIHVMNADGTNPQRLTSTSALEGYPAWSPDGAKIAFESNRDGNFEIYVMDAVDADQDGNGDNLVRLTNNSDWDGKPDWQPVGTATGTDQQVVELGGGLSVPGGMEVTFDDVKTAGSTMLTKSESGQSPPEGFKLVAGSDTLSYYYINTTATYNGSIRVCLKYDKPLVGSPPQPMPFWDQPKKIRLLHWTGSQWEFNPKPPPPGYYLSDQIVCMNVTSLSPFLFAEEVATGVSCADIYLNVSGAAKGKAHVPGVDPLVGQSLTRLEPSQSDPDLSARDITSVLYMGPDQKEGDEPVDDPLDIIADKPPTEFTCQQETASGFVDPEIAEVNPSTKLQSVSNSRPTASRLLETVDDPNNPGTDIHRLAYDTCEFSEELKLWVRTDVNLLIRETGPDAKNFGEMSVFYGTDPPADTLDTDGDTKPDVAVDPGQCTNGLYDLHYIIESHDRVATTDHADEAKNIDLGIVEDPDGPHPKVAGVPQDPDGTDEPASPLAYVPDDWDGDGCPDWDELDHGFINGRDPFNPNDCDWNYTGSYNVLTTVQAATKCRSGEPAGVCEGPDLEPGTPDDLPDGTPVPGIYLHCIAAIKHGVPTGTKENNDLDSRMMCYIDWPGIAAALGSAVPSHADGNAGPPPPPPYRTAEPTELNGELDKITNTLILDGCLEEIGGPLGPNFVLHAEIDAKTLKGTVDIHPNQTIADCDAKTPNQHPGVVAKMLDVPLVLSEQNDNFDHDKDGCSDYEELMGEPPPGKPGVGKCGDGPYNPYDSDADFNSVGSVFVTYLRQDIDKFTGVPIPGAYWHCIYDMQHNTGTNDIEPRLYCYVDVPGVDVNPEAYPGVSGDGDPDSPPPEPYGDIDSNHAVLQGVYDKVGNVLDIWGCIVDKDGQHPWGHLYLDADLDAHTGQGNIDVWPPQTLEDCTGGTPVGVPFAAAIEMAEQGPRTPKVPGSKGWDTDMDGCSDAKELGDNQTAGGLRDPYNRWDFYDINGDQAIDLFIDIFGVAFAFGQGPGGPDYTEAKDRGGKIVGSNDWNQKPPDGSIDLFNDIFGVAFQFGHNCE